jgi:hypothetical protein
MLEADGRELDAVAPFLVRCVLERFAEDVGLVPTGSITKILEDSLSDEATKPRTCPGFTICG